MNNEKRISLGKMQTRADISSSSYSPENHSVEMVASTGSKGLRQPWWGEDYYEELSMDPAHIRLDRINKGGPLLNAHSSYSMKDQIGVISNARVENGQLIVMAKFSERDEVKPIEKDVADGIFKNVSVGYKVHKYEDISLPNDTIRTYRAVDWEPFEVSLVPIGFDADAQIRAANDLNECKIIIPKEEPKMSSENKLTAEQEKQIKDQARAEETARITGIDSICKRMNVSEEKRNKYVSENFSLDKVRQLVIDEKAENDEKNNTSNVNVKITQDETEVRRESVQSALLHKLDPKNELVKNANRYMNMSLLEIGKEMLGRSAFEMSREELAVRSLHATSDLPGIFSNVANKMLRDSYESTVQTFRAIVRETFHNDFKGVDRYLLTDALDLEVIPESGLVKYGSLGEEKESYKLISYGKAIGFTRQMIINDDLDALKRIPSRFGRNAANLESDIVWGIFNSNPKMSDNKALFHADHGNLAGSGAAPSDATIQAGETAMGNQKIGNHNLGITPKFIMANIARKIAIMKLLKDVQSTKGDDVNAYAGVLTPIFEPRLAAGPWYLAADVAGNDVIEIAYLQGQRGVKISQMIDFDSEGMKIKALHDFGAKAIDFRTLYKNPGN